MDGTPPPTGPLVNEIGLSDCRVGKSTASILAASPPPSLGIESVIDPLLLCHVVQIWRSRLASSAVRDSVERPSFPKAPSRFALSEA